MAKAGMKALVRVSGAPLSLTNEACAEVAGSGLKKYRVTDAAKRVLDRTEYIGVQQNTDGVNWVGVSAADYTLNRLTGTITFHVARATGTLVRISTGKYLPMATAAECRDFSLSLSGNNVSVASFGTEWEKRLATTKDVSGSLSRWASTDKYFRDNLTGGKEVVIEFWHDSTLADPDFRIWAVLASDEMSAAIDGAQEEAVEFEGTTDADGNSLTTFS